MTGTDVEKRAPPVQWAERRNILYIFVHVPDSQKPAIQLSADKLYFRTKSNAGIEYEVTLNFYKDVNVESSKYCLSDRGVDFILKKAEEGPFWNRLLKDDKKYHWLKIDFNRWRDEDDSDVEMDEEEFDSMMKKMSGLQSTSRDMDDLDTETEEEEEAAA